MQRMYASLPYAIHRAYGARNVRSTLESAIEQSVHTGGSGFAIIARAHRGEQILAARDGAVCPGPFSELDGADDTKALAFLKARQ
jgi:hypothetical protein